MEILEAYCVELNRVVDIYQAQKEFFKLSECDRKRFTFGCSDVDCRALKNPLVSGVNYHQLVEETEKYRQVHFRAPSGNPHLATCIWVLGDTSKKRLIDSTDDGMYREALRKTTNVIDVFQPKKKGDQVTTNLVQNQASSGLSINDRLVDGNETEGQTRSREGYTSTIRLERFINCWAQFEGDELKQYEVVIEGLALSYRQAVLRPNWILPAENGTRILFGGARAKFWPETNPKRLYINFMDACEKFCEHGGDRSLTIDIPLDRIANYNGGALLLKRIEQAQVLNHYLQVYCWGEIIERENKSGYLVEISSLDNLVLKAVSKKKST